MKFNKDYGEYILVIGNDPRDGNVWIEIDGDVHLFPMERAEELLQKLSSAIEIARNVE